MNRRRSPGQTRGPSPSVVGATRATTLNAIRIGAHEPWSRGSVAVLETQVVATPTGLMTRGLLSGRCRALVDFAEQPRSLAEISARLQCRLESAFRMVCDLSESGYLAVYLPNPRAVADVRTLEAVIAGLVVLS